MSAASNYLENKVLDHVLTSNTYSAPGARYLALFTDAAATNLEAGVLTNEVSVGAYARAPVTFANASNGAAANNAMVAFPVATASWGTITHVAVMDALTAGNVLFWAPVVVQKTIDAGDTFLVFVNNLSITLN